MISGSASRNTKYSIVAMIFFGLVALLSLFYALDRWLLSGLYTEKVVNLCQSLGATCQNAFLSVEWSPIIIAILIGLGALVFALMRAVMILISSNRKAANFFLASKWESVKFRKVVQKIASFEKVPEIKILASEEPLAFTSGLLRPTIYLSEGLIKVLTAGELEAVILHEYAHVKRRDNLAIFSMLFLRDFLFMLPLAHFLFRVYIREKENAADDFVSQAMSEPSSLASALLKLIRLNHRKKDPAPAYATFSPSRETARSRIVRLVGEPENRQAKEIINLVLAFVASVLILVLVTGATFKLSSASALRGCPTGITCEKANHNCCTIKGSK